MLLSQFPTPSHSGEPATTSQARSIQTIPGMPPVIDPANLYSETRAGKLSPAVAGALPRVYVPNRMSNDVSVIDPPTLKVVDRFEVGVNPQHVVPSWDLKTLWVTNNAEDARREPHAHRPMTAKPERHPSTIRTICFTPDGRSAIVVMEGSSVSTRPHAMTLQRSLAVPGCAGINHADFSIDGRYAIFTCNFREAWRKSIRRTQGCRLSQALEAGRQGLVESAGGSLRPAIPPKEPACRRTFESPGWKIFMSRT
jgi:YVTN family beta-propeller protein